MVYGSHRDKPSSAYSQKVRGGFYTPKFSSLLEVDRILKYWKIRLDKYHTRHIMQVTTCIEEWNTTYILHHGGHYSLWDDSAN